MKLRISHFKILILLFLVSLTSLIFGLKLNYPPYESELSILTIQRINSSSNLTIQQRQEVLKNILGENQFNNEKLFCLRGKLQAITGFNTIIGLRIVNFLLLLFGLIAFCLFLKEIKLKPKTIFISTLIILISPLFLSLWLFYAKLSLTIFLIFLWLYLYKKESFNTKKDIALAITVPALFLSSLQGVIISLFIFLPLTLIKFFKERKSFFISVLAFLSVLLIVFFLKNPSFKQDFSQINIFDSIRSEKITQQIEQRITNEDGLQTKVSFPLWFRRLGYNKLFFAYRNLSQEFLSFFDLETLFFQEVHPMHQKSEVIFFWPEIFLFVIGLIYIIRNKSERENKDLIFLLSISIIFYLCSPNTSISIKHSLTFFTLSLVVAKSFEKINKKALLLIVPILLWAILINSYDISKRPLFWYDNRPFVYSQGMQALKEKGLGPIKNIHITNLVGNPKLYYFYFFSPDPKTFLADQDYIKDQNKKIFFQGFNLSQSEPQDDSIYFGFLGEFIGAEPSNNFKKEDLEKLEAKNFKTEKVWKLDNTIAFRYSDYFILGLKQN